MVEVIVNVIQMAMVSPMLSTFAQTLMIPLMSTWMVFQTIVITLSTLMAMVSPMEKIVALDLMTKSMLMMMDILMLVMF